MHDWRRNQAALMVASFVGFTGFTLVMQTHPHRIRFVDIIHLAENADRGVKIRF